MPLFNISKLHINIQQKLLEWLLSPLCFPLAQRKAHNSPLLSHPPVRVCHWINHGEINKKIKKYVLSAVLFLKITTLFNPTWWNPTLMSCQTVPQTYYFYSSGSLPSSVSSCAATFRGSVLSIYPDNHDPPWSGTYYLHGSVHPQDCCQSFFALVLYEQPEYTQKLHKFPFIMCVVTCQHRGKQYLMLM